jgi:hypothetical protein
MNKAIEKRAAMHKLEKGTYGYIENHKKRQLLKTFIFFLLPAAIFIVGLVTTKTKSNYFTVVALVGSLPACKELVNVIVFARLHSMPQELYEKMESHVKGMVAAYELNLTTYEKNYPIQCIIVAGNEVVGYAEQKDLDHRKVEEHIQSILKQNGLSAHIHIFQDLKQFLERADQLSLTLEERHQDSGREQSIRDLILAISM